MTDALIDLLSNVAHGFQQRLRDGVEAADIGLTSFEAKSLATIARMPGSTQQVIAARMRCDKAQLARAVKALEAQNLITRNASTEDWRAWNLALTRGGEELFTELQARRSAVAEACLADVSTDEQKQLATILTKIVAAL